MVRSEIENSVLGAVTNMDSCHAQIVYTRPLLLNFTRSLVMRLQTAIHNTYVEYTVLIH